VRDATMRYVAAHPDATYDEIEAACFPGRDGELALFALSPRHLEACATRTGQILVEGGYSDVLEPGRHYLPVRADLSDLGEVLEAAKDEDRRRALTDAAYEDIVASGRWTYRGFVEQVDGVLLAGPEPGRRPLLRAAELAGRAYDWLAWRRVAMRVTRSRAYRLAGKLRRLSPRRPPRPARPTVVSVTPLRLDADSRTLKEAVSLARAGLRSIVVERFGSTESWDDVPIEVVSLAPSPSPAPAAAAGSSNGGPPPEPPRPPLGYYVLKPFLKVFGPWLGLALTTRATLAKLPPADLYWVHSVPQLPAVAIRARRNGVPFIYDAHDFYSDSKHNDGLTWVDRWGIWVYEVVERMFVRFAAERVTVGAGVKELQETHFGRPFAVLHNAHDHRLDRDAAPDVREALELGDDDFLVVAAGNSKTGTAFEPIFDALAALPDHVHLAFVGRNYDAAMQLARERGVDGRVHFLPPVPPAEVKSFIAGADAAAILYFPITSNFLNALPNRLYQAIAAGLPLLYPETMRAIRALCEEHDVGVPIDPRDAASVLAGIERLLADPAELARLRANARRAADQVNWEREEEKLKALVGELVAR
jgi:glycosyltransferase involved in cell wall biosynthesis